MLIFWAVAAALTAVAAGLIFYRARLSGAGDADPSQHLYRRQLAELDDLAARDLIGQAEHKAAKAEAARRLLAAADAAPEPWTSGARGPLLAGAALVPALALGVYLVVGAPGVPDQPYARRLAEWKRQPLDTLAAPQIAAILREATTQRSNDAEGFRLLALAEAGSQNPAGAVRALRRAVTLAPERADLWRTLGEAIVFRDAGKVQDEAQRAFGEALRRDPGDITARFYLAQATFEAGDLSKAAQAFRGVLAALPADDPRRPAVEQAIARAEGRARPNFPPEQLKAIQGMVEGLAAKLAVNPDNPDGWVRLVRAYTVLGELDKRDAALAKARARYKDAPQILEQIEAAARPAGSAQ